MIYVNGDSWSFGMYDENNLQKLVWPDLLAKELGHDLINDSIGCSSNSRILSSTENFYIKGGTPQLIILALTGHNRIHIPGPGLSHWNISSRMILNDSIGILNEVSNQKICDWFVKNSYDELDSVYRYYRTVWNLHNICQKFNCMSMMFQAWDEELQSFKLLDDSTSIEDFVYAKANKDWVNDNMIHRYILGFKFFRKESKNWNMIGPTFRTVLSTDDYDNTGHPNENGHRLISQFVLQYINNQNLRKWL